MMKLSEAIEVIEGYIHEFGFVNLSKRDILDSDLIELKKDYSVAETETEYIFTEK